MRNSKKKRWKEGPQFQNEYGGFDQDLILIFGLNLSIGFTVLSRGTHSYEFLVVKMLHMRCNPWEKTPIKISHSTSSCTGSDDPALGRMIWPHIVWTFGVSPDVGWSGPVPDDPDLGISVCVLPFLVLPRMIRDNSGWSGHHQKTHNDHLQGWDYIYPFTPFLHFSLFSRPTSTQKH